MSEKETELPEENAGADDDGSAEPQVLALKRRGATWRLSRREMLLATATGAGAVVLEGCADGENSAGNSNNPSASAGLPTPSPTPTPTPGISIDGPSGGSSGGSSGGGSSGGGSYRSGRHYWRPN